MPALNGRVTFWNQGGGMLVATALGLKYYFNVSALHVLVPSDPTFVSCIDIIISLHLRRRR